MRSLDISTHLLERFAALPAALALPTHPDYAGRGVTIAVLDAAFTAHPDLTEPSNRILGYYDATEQHEPLDANRAELQHWHGTMTSVVTAGNGHLSNGFFRSLAPEARVVLIKTWGEKGLREEYVLRGLRWLLKNREKYQVKVLTMSVRSNEAILSAYEDEADRLAEELVRQGVSVVCAAGNDYCVSRPPANAPSVITVGGLSLEGRQLIPYDASCFGETVDGLMKPELVALAGQVAAPLVLNTETARQAAALTSLAEAAPHQAAGLAAELWEQAGLEADPDDLEPGEILEMAAEALRERSFLSPFYKSVDGTSFAAPMVAGVVAQMLEANPSLHPRQIKQILMQTADVVEGIERERQGFGLINPRRAVGRALEQPRSRPESGWFRLPELMGKKTVFRQYRPAAGTVALAGNFNDWTPDPMVRLQEGVWELALPLPPGEYLYKFVVDGDWQADPNNLHLVDDGLGGFNSQLLVPS
jgi:serine protease AprX